MSGLTEDDKKKQYEKGRKLVSDWLKASTQGNLKTLQNLAKLYVARGDYSSEKSVLNQSIDGNGRNALHFASAQGYNDCINYLLTLDSDLINKADDQGDTPLSLACINDRANSIKLLVEKKADINQDLGGKTPLHVACSSCSKDTVEWLIEHGGNLNNHPAKEMGDYVYFACSEQNIDVVRYLFTQGQSANFSDAQHVTPLILACVHTNPQLISLLLENGADPKCCLEDNVTPLHIVGEAGHLPCLLPFLSLPNIKELCNIETTKDHNKPIDFAAGSEAREIVEKLYPLTEGRQDMTIDELINQYKEDPKKEPVAATTTSSSGPLPNKSIALDIKEKAEDYKVQGNLCFKSKDYEGAIKNYTLAIETNPVNHIYFSNRSASYLNINDYENALKDAKECQRLNPTWAKGFYREGEVYMIKQQYEEAAQSFFAGCNLEPTNTELSNAFARAIELGRAQYKTQHPEAAETKEE
ncbi:hypothetical protein WA158_005393 [Blastocystis sp. Blastoise]